MRFAALAPLIIISGAFYARRKVIAFQVNGITVMGVVFSR